MQFVSEIFRMIWDWIQVARTLHRQCIKCSEHSTVSTFVSKHTCHITNVNAKKVLIVILKTIIIMSPFLPRAKKILRCAGWHKQFSVSVQMSEPCT